MSMPDTLRTKSIMVKKVKKIVLVAVIIVISAMLLKIKLQEKTEIETITFIREQSTPHTVYYRGIYLFYDKSKGGICSEKNGQVEFLFHTKEPQAISANKNYIYTVCDESMQQYKRDGSLVAQNEGISYDDIYASEQYVYCLWSLGVVVVSSDNITKPIEREIKAEDIKKNIEYADQDSHDRDLVSYRSIDMGTEWIVWSCSPQSEFQPEIEYHDAGVWIEYPCTVISKKTGNPLIRSEHTPLNFKHSLVIEDDTPWQATDQILKREKNKVEVLVDLEGDAIVFPTGNGTAYVDDPVLCVAGSLFETFPMPFSSHSVYANGPMNEQKREILRYVDLNHQENAKSYHFSKGNKVVYADKEEFILYHKGLLEFYNADDGSLKKKVKMKGVRRNEKYTVELCHEKLFFYQKGEIAETVNIK
ncbi:hypothetical protein AALC75_27005 [Lachnospiraceae bacterium 48-42]